jgi:hypothetical protein
MLLNRARYSVSRATRPRTRTRSDWFVIVYCLALAAFLLVALGQAVNSIADYPLEILLCFIVGGLSIYGQFLSLRREASIHFGSFIFCFLFMSAAPIVQLGANVEPIFNIDHWAFWASLNALAFTTIGVLITFRMKRPDNKPESGPTIRPSQVNYLFVFLLTVVTAGIAIVLFHDSLFTNRDEFAAASDRVFVDPTISLLARMFFFYTPFFGAIIGFRSSVANRQKIWIVLFSLGMLMAAIVNNPLINPRYQLAGLAFFAIDYLFYGKKTKLFAVLLIVGVLLGPVFQAFRHGISNSESSEDEQLFSTTLLSKDYDAFQMSCYTMLTVDESGISWGSNILGAVLFFVPRSWWPEKPRPTSWITYDTASHTTELGTNNLSTPLMAEGYYAFGWIGALAIGIFYWWAISRITLLSRKDFYSWPFLSRCLFAGLVLIFLRGTLTVGVSALGGSFVAAAIPMFLIRYRFRAGGRYLLRGRLAKVRQSSRVPSDQTQYP